MCPSIQNVFTHYLCISLPQAFDDYVGSPERGGEHKLLEGGGGKGLVGNSWRFDITQRGVQNFNPACLIVQSRDGHGFV